MPYMSNMANLNQSINLSVLEVLELLKRDLEQLIDRCRNKKMRSQVTRMKWVEVVKNSRKRTTGRRSTVMEQKNKYERLDEDNG